jgi:adenosylhomocysteine nucleosidase
MMKTALFCILCVLLTFSACQPAQAPAAEPLDATPRVAIVSAFEPELKQILSQTEGKQVYQVNGRSFTTGKLAGREVLVFLSGVSMVNAAMNTQAALDHFPVRAIIFSGIAGGANPSLHIGDVVVPAQWAEYQEQVLARQTASGWDTGFHQTHLGNYGMMFPMEVAVTRGGGPVDKEESRFWFAVDPGMLASAKAAAGQVALKRCPQVGGCLSEPPKMVVGGKGVSGESFVDNADYRQWVWKNFQADAVDMETAAVAHVAYVNGVPFLAFRSLSDLAGGGPGQNEMVTFLQLAADNSSAAVLGFMKEWK